MTGTPEDTSLTIDTHHHILPDFFWQETEKAHAPVGGLAPLRWSKVVDPDAGEPTSIRRLVGFLAWRPCRRKSARANGDARLTSDNR